MHHGLYIIIIFFIGISFSSTSCSDYLDAKPDDELTLEMVFNNKVKTEQWLAGVYAGLPDTYMMYLRNIEPLGDDVIPSIQWEAYNWDIIAKLRGNWNANSNWDTKFWTDLPKRIRSAYIFMENVKALPDQYVSEEEVTYMKAECRFLIAYYYYLLVNYWGAIPLQKGIIDVEASVEEALLGQSTYDATIDWLNSEMYEAAQILPAFYNEARKSGRVTSVGCMAVRARMLLFAASPLVNGNADYEGFVNDKGEQIFNPVYDASKWTRATEACKEAITLAESNGYELYKEYNNDRTIDPFLSYQNMLFTTPPAGNKELLFARPFANGYWVWDRTSTPRSLGGNGGTSATQSLVDAYFMSNGLPAILGHNDDGSPIINAVSGYREDGFTTSVDSRKTKWVEGEKGANPTYVNNAVAPKGIFNMYYDREPRFYISVRYNESWHRLGNKYVDFRSGKADGGPTRDAPQNGYLLRKKVHPDHDSKNSKDPNRPVVIARLGELYLNYIEALNETNPGHSDILLYLNKIRERAGIPTYGSGSGQIPVPSDMKEAIRRERRVELCLEGGIRFDDIRRWKLGEELLDGMTYGLNFSGTDKSFDKNNSKAFYVRKPFFTRVFKFKNYWMPIPQSDIDKNKNLRQLPEW